MLPALLTFGRYYIAGDFTHQMLPFLYEAKRMFASGFPLWSWNTYFGDNFIASYAYYTAFNPFTWINCLFPYRYLTLGFTIVLYLKFLVCAYISQKYLKKIGFDDRLSLLGCLLYTFSSWAISNLIYYMFLEPMILFPLLLIFIERFLRGEKHAYSGLSMAVFVVVMVNYYFASVNLIAATIYFFCRMLSLDDMKGKVLATTVRAAGCVVLGICCSSFMLCPVLYQLKGSPAQSMNFDTSDLALVADRLFWLLYPKANDGKFYYLFLNPLWKSNAASLAVFGFLPTVLLFARKGFGWIKWLVAVFVLIYITPLNGIFSLFTDLYYTRWAYALTLSMIVATLYYIRNYGMPRFKYAVIYCVLIYGAYFLFYGASVAWHYKESGDLLSVASVRLTLEASLMALNALVLLFLCQRRWIAKKDACLIPIISVCLAAQFGIYSLPGSLFQKSTTLTETDYFVNDFDFRREGDFHYRTDFTVIGTGGRPSSNFGLITNRPSVQTYHSVQNRNILKWNSIIGGTDPNRLFFPTRHVASYEALMSVKDLAIVSRVPVDSMGLGEVKERNGFFTVYESDHYIPMGFAYDQYFISSEVEALAAGERNVDLPVVVLSGIAIEKDDEPELAPYLRKGVIDENVDLDSLVSARRAVACDSFIGHTRGFDAHICLDSAKVVFFSVVADDGFSAYIDDEPTKIYEANLGFSAVVVPAGCHDISFRYYPPGLGLGLLLSAIGLLITGVVFYKERSYHQQM